MRISDWSSDVCSSDLSRSELRSNTQHRRDQRGPSETAPMKVHAVLQTGEAATIGTGLAVELDGASIGQDQPRQGEQDAGLTGANLSAIVPDQPRAMRDPPDAARGAVINISRNRAGDLARQGSG